MNPGVQVMLMVTCMLAIAVLFASLLSIRNPPTDVRVRLEDGRVVVCVVANRPLAQSVSCDWATARRLPRPR